MNRIKFASDSSVAEDTETDWLVAETGYTSIRDELLRLKRRARKRPVSLFVFTLLGVLLILGKLAMRKPMYTATVVLRATEGGLLDEDSAFVGAELANYLYSVALNQKRLMPIIEEHDLYPKRGSLGAQYAIEKLREFLDIEINSNEFFQPRDEDNVNSHRSVGIAIHFADRDPDQAFNVARDLSDALVEAEQDKHKEAASKLQYVADEAVANAEAQLRTMYEDMTKATILLGKIRNNRSPEQRRKTEETKISMRRLSREIKATEAVLKNMVALQAKSSRASAAVDANQAMRFDVVDVLRPLLEPKRSAIELATLGLFLFIFLLPFSTILLTSSDSRLHHIDDLVRLNLPVVGHIPAFLGDSTGSLRQRTRLTKHKKQTVPYE